MLDRHENTSDPLDPWELWARAVLDDPEHTSALGVAVARDAQRVAAGALDEDEFRARYEAAYLQAFQVDDRPRLADGLSRPGRDTDDPEAGDGPRTETGERRIPDGPTVVSRRAVLGALGGAAAGALFFGELFRRGAFAATPLGGGEALTAAGHTAAGDETAVQFGMVIDLERCDGCLRCVDACVEENGLSEGVLWPYVFAYQEPEDADPRYLVRLCQHCTRAPCVMVCPTGARHRRLADGLVLTDYDVCIGCRYCQVACPYGVNVFQWADPATYGGSFEGERRDARGVAVKGDPPLGVMGKCTFCPLRQDDPERRGTAACVDACSMDALHIGDLNDPDSAPNRHLARRREEVGGNLPTFRLLEDLGTEPNIIYIGQPPSSRAGLVEGSWAYEDWGLTEDRRAVLEGPQPWFRRLAQEA
jgi:Fe-S-cluster-containing dehydrogenase component